MWIVSIISSKKFTARYWRWYDWISYGFWRAKLFLNGASLEIDDDRKP